MVTFIIKLTHASNQIYILSYEFLGAFNLQKEYSYRRFFCVFCLLLIVLQVHGYVRYGKAQNSEKGTIVGNVSIENSPVMNVKITLFNLRTDERQIVHETFTNSDGSYEFTNLTEASEYMVTVAFKDKTHSKYVLLNNSSRENFNFNGKIKVDVIGIDEIYREGLELKLYNIFGEIETNTTTESDGVGVFKSIDVQDTYYVSLEYQKIVFTGIVEFEDKNFTEIQIDVLESTRSDEDFQVKFQHIIIRGENSDLSFRETITVQNTGEKVFNTSWLQGWIPENAYDISHDTMECCIQFHQTGDYEYDPMAPIFPNDSYSLSLNYRLEANTPTQIIEKRVIYDTENIFFLIKKTEKIATESISGVNLVGVETYGENDYYIFEGSTLKAGDLIQIKVTTRVSILERISVSRDMLENIQIALPLILVVLFFVYQNRKKSLRKTEENEAEWIWALVDAEIEFLEGEISLEELERVNEEAELVSFEILEKNNGQNPNETPESRMILLKTATIRRVAEKVLETISEDLEEGYISEETYNIIYPKYHERAD